MRNALKFTLNGLVRVIVAYEESESLLKVHIADNGRGIQAEEIDQLFKMFGKLKRTAKENHDGIGMGLMICQNLVQENGGTLTVHSDGEN